MQLGKKWLAVVKKVLMKTIEKIYILIETIEKISL